MNIDTRVMTAEEDRRETRKFETGATRSSDAQRHDPEGFLSPLALERFCEYMTKHRLQADGKLRDSDNWQKGMPLTTYIKGMWRHFLHLWQRHRGWTVVDPFAAANIEEDLCAIIFNAQGYLHELVKGRRSPPRGPWEQLADAIIGEHPAPVNGPVLPLSHDDPL